MDTIEHTFDQGIHRITLPLPTGPKHVHAYVVPGEAGPILVDTGFGGWDRWPEVAQIVVTHMHPDHVGGAQEAADQTGAAVHQGAIDYAQTERVWGSGDWPERIAEWFDSHGVPRELTDELIAQGHAFSPFVRYRRGPALLYEGGRVGGWDVLELPGHADGHIGLLRDGILVAGDHLLEPITPAVGLYPESRPDPLGDYLRSLQRVIELAPTVAYGGHGEPIADPAGRAGELIEHHRRRLDETEQLLGGTAFEISGRLFPRAQAPTQRRFAVAETLSHLERLVREGRARRVDDRPVSYHPA